MATLPVRTADGADAGSVELPAEVFEVPVNVHVMHRVVKAQQAAARAGTHSTKTRAQVRGGGKKPWRQKGTGRARQGSIRAPQWTGGGVAFGPHPRDYTQQVNKKERQLALRSALSDRRAGGNLVVLDALDFEAPRTKQAVALIDRLGLAGRKLLLVVEGSEDAAIKSFRNLPRVHLLDVGQLNTYDVLVSDAVLFTRASLDAFLGRGDEPEAKAKAEQPKAKAAQPKAKAKARASEPADDELVLEDDEEGARHEGPA